MTAGYPASSEPRANRHVSSFARNTWVSNNSSWRWILPAFFLPELVNLITKERRSFALDSRVTKSRAAKRSSTLVSVERLCANARCRLDTAESPDSWR